jgi:methylenetetrahydrofolate dehydrogenase (NADP+)/methenyltetrahydrofolate cyclohydrolase/formyltetrahydrofolate synthetase
MPFSSPARSAAALPRCHYHHHGAKAKCFFLNSRRLHSSSYLLPLSSPRISSSFLLNSRQFSAGRGVGLHSHCALRPLRPNPTSYKEFTSTPFSVRRSFSSTGTTMAATKIDGTQIAKSIRAGLKNEIQQTQESNPRFKPSLVIFQGTDSQTHCPNIQDC